MISVTFCTVTIPMCMAFSYAMMVHNAGLGMAVLAGRLALMIGAMFAMTAMFSTPTEHVAVRMHVFGVALTLLSAQALVRGDR